MVAFRAELGEAAELDRERHRTCHPADRQLALKGPVLARPVQPGRAEGHRLAAFDVEQPFGAHMLVPGGVPGLDRGQLDSGGDGGSGGRLADDELRLEVGETALHLGDPEMADGEADGGVQRVGEPAPGPERQLGGGGGGGRAGGDVIGAGL
jgi:hypothetical protein